MRTSVRVRVIVAAAMLAMAGAACGSSGIEFFGVGGSRFWIITVVNDSPGPAVLAVAEAKPEGPMGDIVGRAEPAVVEAGATVEVRFTVPAGEGWAIFVNHGPNNTPAIGPRDVPPARIGKLPLTISIAADDNLSVSAPGEPGWLGG